MFKKRLDSSYNKKDSDKIKKGRFTICMFIIHLHMRTSVHTQRLHLSNQRNIGAHKRNHRQDFMITNSTLSPQAGKLNTAQYCSTDYYTFVIKGHKVCPKILSNKSRFN